MATHNELGKEGERRAIGFLRENGYEILETNWRYGKAEIDIIARKDSALVVVEVKTRSAIAFGLPQDFVNPKKIKLLVNAIDHYCRTIDFNGEVRFDIIAIVSERNQWELDHIADAFYYF